MKRRSLTFSLVAMLCLVALVLPACTPETPATTPAGTTPVETSPATSTPDATVTPEVTPTPTEPDEPYVFPADGVLKALEDGKAPGMPDGRNPALSGDKIVVFFEYAFRKAGLELSADTEINYTITKSGESPVTGTAKLDTSVPEIKNEYGYIGVCFDTGFTFDKFNKATLEFSFKDASGKEYTVKNQTVYKGLSYLGLDASAFDEYLGGTVKTVVGKQKITQTATINGTDFTFTIYLSRWAGKTKAKQIITCSRLFWQTYPRMYARFGAAGNSPTNVGLTIENQGYGIASAGGSEVHLHDQWLMNNPQDFDCLTHEFAHVIQNGWDGDYCEYSGYIERFADACRYMYAFDDGKYNDSNWTLNTVSGENTRETSVRFLVWMDYFYSNEENDLILKFFTACRSKKYPANKWNEAWAEIFDGTELQGKSIEEVWSMFESSEFAKLSARGIATIVGSSALLKKYDIRGRLK